MNLHFIIRAALPASIILFNLLPVQGQVNKRPFLAPDIWLRADRYDTRKPFWPDESAMGMNAFPANGFKPVTDSLINFNSALTLDGVDDKFTIHYKGNISSAVTVVSVYRSDNKSDERGIWNVMLSNEQDINMTNQRSTGPMMITHYSESAMTFPVINSTSQSWSKIPSRGPDPVITVGAATLPGETIRPFSGLMAEYLVFDRLLTIPEATMLQSYLAIKYSASLEFSDYVSSYGTITWNSDQNSGYRFSIAGIGRDDNFGLYQKQSTVTDSSDNVTISAGRLAVSNPANSTSLSNNNFLVWGNDGKSPYPGPDTTGTDYFKYPLIERRWKISATGADWTSTSTFLKYRLPKPASEIKQCFLIIDRGAKGEFLPGSTLYLTADSVSASGDAFFKNINWDTDLSGSDLFTFSYGDYKPIPVKSLAGNNQKIRERNHLSTNYNLFPNPTSGAYNITIDMPLTSDVTIRILDTRGTSITEHTGKNASWYIFRGNILEQGLYLVEIRSAAGRDIFKLIVTN
jgi:hypothetical protein